MSVYATPHGPAFGRRDSCVVDVRSSNLGLFIVVEVFPSEAPKSMLVQLFFSHHHGFFLLDEGDMPGWLRPEVVRSGHVFYEITGGGWMSQLEGTGTLAIARASAREWLVVTANECVSVFSRVEPLVTELPS